MSSCQDVSVGITVSVLARDALVAVCAAGARGYRSDSSGDFGGDVRGVLAFFDKWGASALECGRAQGVRVGLGDLVAGDSVSAVRSDLSACLVEELRKYSSNEGANGATGVLNDGVNRSGVTQVVGSCVVGEEEVTEESVPRGVWAKRERRRRARARRRQRSAVPEWRANAAPLVDSDESKAPVKKAGFFAECDEATQVKLRETRARLLIAQNERALVEEQRKLKELQSPMRIIQDAMKMVNFAEKCAKASNDNKVAGWAATVSNSYAESVARSAGSSVPSLDSVASANELRQKQSKLEVSSTPLTSFERIVVDEGVMTLDALVVARKKALRPLVYGDFTRKNLPSTISAEKVRWLRCVVEGRTDCL